MKNKVKILGIIAIAVIIGLAMTGCEAKSVDIVVSNNSSYPVTDSTVLAQVWGTAGGTTPLEGQNVPYGESVTFTMDEGDYRVRIIDGLDYKWWYPSENSVTNMTGTVRLKFTGSSLVKQ